jgi:hypothetical protein
MLEWRMFASMYVKGLLAVALNAKSFLEVVINCPKMVLLPQAYVTFVYISYSV